MDIDLFEAGKSVGMSFDEFRRNPEKYIGKQDEVLASIEKGGQTANGFTQKHIYEICGYRTRSLVEVEKIAKEHGLNLRDLDYKAVAMPVSSHKADILVKIMHKDEIKRRDANYAQGVS